MSNVSDFGGIKLTQFESNNWPL